MQSPIYVTKPMLPSPEAFHRELSSIWESHALTNGGQKHEKLEEKLKAYLKAPYLSLFNNGTIALLAAIKALELSGEVITTPFTFPATAHVLAWAGLKPIFCDIDPVTMNIDPKMIVNKITAKTSGILGVHVYGTPCAVIEIDAIAKDYGLKVIYDAAHAFGVELEGKGIGSFGDATMFSFHATKLFHTAEGGAIVCRDSQIKARIDLMKNFGIVNEEEVVFPGINGKLNEIQAALGLANLDILDKEREERQKLHVLYCEELDGIPGLILPEMTPTHTQSLQYFPLRIQGNLFGMDRNRVHDLLKERNIFTRKYFFPLCSDYPCYREENGDLLPIARQVVQEVLCIPFYGTLGMDVAKMIAQIIRSFSQRGTP